MMQIPPAVRSIVTLLCICIAHNVHAAPTAAVHVDGDVSTPAVYNNSQLSGAEVCPVKTVQFTDKSGRHTAECVSLLDLVTVSKPLFNSHVKNGLLRFMIEVRGYDGYIADFSVAELSPQFGRESAWLELGVDKAQLPAKLRPTSLIVPGDLKHGRWVHAVAEITVLDCGRR